MKRLVIAGLWLISAGASFYAGAIVGTREFLLANAQYQASITATYLRALEQKRIPQLSNALELDLDGYLALHGAYLDSQLTWLWPELRADTPRAITFAANYRATHPVDPLILASPDSNDPAAQEIQRGLREHTRQVERVVKKYADEV